MLKVRFLAAFLLLASSAYGENRLITVEPGIIEIRIPKTTETGDLEWESQQPVDLSYKTYRLDNGDEVLVTYAVAGSRLIVSSDYTDWNGTRIVRSKIKWLIKVEGSSPAPVPPPPSPFPPGPEPPTPPAPVPPSPTPSVPNFYGVGAISYSEAVKINQKPHAANLAQTFTTAYTNLHEGRWLPDKAADFINQNTVALPPEWKPWIAAVSQALSVSRSKHGRGITIQRDQYREVAEALLEAAK